MICRTTSLYDKNRTTISYDFYRSSDISLTPCQLRHQGPSPTGFNGCSMRLPEWSVEPGSLIAACPNCFTLSYIGWTFHNVSSINSESQFTGVCRTRLLSTWWTAAHVHPTSQAVNTFDRPTVNSWWFHDTVAARLVIRLSPLRVLRYRTRFQTLSGTLLGVPTASDRLWKLIFLCCKGTISAFEALRDTLYKSTTTATIVLVLVLVLLFTTPASNNMTHWSQTACMTVVAHIFFVSSSNMSLCTSRKSTTGRTMPETYAEAFAGTYNKEHTEFNSSTQCHVSK